MKTFDFGSWAGPGATSTIERDGFTLTATLHADDCADAPWDRADGHGPVSGWRGYGYNQHPTKAPGERVLISDGRSARFYDFAEAVKLARRDDWGTAGDAGLTPGAKAARAAEADFAYLKSWCDDQWSYVGVSVTVERDGAELVSEFEHALWGVESNSGDYLAEIAGQVAEEALDAAGAAWAAHVNCEA